MQTHRMLEGKLATAKYRALTLFVSRRGDEPGRIQLMQNGQTVTEIACRYLRCEAVTIAVEAQSCYMLECCNVDVNYAYLHEAVDGDPSISYLEVSEKGICTYSSTELGACLSQKHRSHYHFSPIRGWMNDPNGLCRFNGQYHMFYQFNPADQVWGNVFWGHAVSKDLLHWKHLPAVLHPQPELTNTPELRGGAYSGTALPYQGKLHLFFTRHVGDQARTWCREWTVTCSSDDGLCFGPEEICVKDLPSELGQDFRDPKVFFNGNGWSMLTGTQTGNRAAISVHRSKDLKHWRYEGLFYIEEREKYRCAECPDLLMVDGKYVLIAGYHNDPRYTDQKRRDVRYYIGILENGRFVAQAQGLLDYGGDFYAAQTFADVCEPIMIGWNNDRENRHVAEENGANGTMSLPRRLRICGEKLYSYPIEAVRALEKAPVRFSGTSGFVQDTQGRYHLRLTQEICEDFCLRLAGEGDESVVLSFERGVVGVCVCKERYVFTDRINLRTVDAFVDRSLLELFINEGEWAFTRRFYLTDFGYTVSAQTAPAQEILIAEMCSIWQP